MTLEKAREMIFNWLNSEETLDNDWKIVLNICLVLIDEKLITQ